MSEIGSDEANGMPERGYILYPSKYNSAAKEEVAMHERSRTHSIPYQKQDGHRRRWRRIPVFALALVFGMSLALLAILPVGLVSQLIPVAQAHAVLLRSDPPANATLRVPPARVRLWFDDDLVPATSPPILPHAPGHQRLHARSLARPSRPRRPRAASGSSSHTCSAWCCWRLSGAYWPRRPSWRGAGQAHSRRPCCKRSSLAAASASSGGCVR